MTDKDWMLIFGSLKEGHHSFEYKLNDEFFQSIDQDLIHKGDVDVLLGLERFERQLELHFSFKGWVEKTCDICLSVLKYPVNTKAYLHVKITDKSFEDEPELICVESNAYELNLKPHLFDFVVLSLPMQIKCQDAIDREECDEDVINKLEPDSDETSNSDHPEWQKLKGLFNN